MTEHHGERAHARLSPSGAKRWMSCPGSVRLEAALPDQSSPFARQGTAAHELSERCLRAEQPAIAYLGETIDLQDSGPTFIVDGEMAANVQVYLDYIASVCAAAAPHGEFEFEIESRLNIEHVVAGMFGTVDYLFYSTALGLLHVIDLKYGQGVAVEPEHNPQLMHYALGAVRRYHNRPLRNVMLTIVQPRASHPRGPIRSWQTTPADLEAFADESRAAAALTEQPDAPLVPGDHCGFCKAAGFCPALREQALALAAAEFDDQTGHSPSQIAEWLGCVAQVETWCKNVREFANAEGKAGRMPTGHKFVEKRATRKFRDESEAVTVARVVFELTDEQIFTTPELRSPAQIEKVVGKARMKPFSRFITQQSSGLVLVPESDPRPAAQASAADEFDAVDVE